MISIIYIWGAITNCSEQHNPKIIILHCSLHNIKVLLFTGTIETIKKKAATSARNITYYYHVCIESPVLKLWFNFKLKHSRWL